MMQSPAQTGQHASCEARVAVDFREYDVPGYVQQLGVVDGLCRHQVRLFDKHQGFAEALPRPHQRHHLLPALRRLENELYPAIHNDVKAAAGVATAQQNGAARRINCDRLAGNALNVSAGQLPEQRYVGEKIFGWKWGSGHADELDAMIAPTLKPIVREAADYGLM